MKDLISTTFMKSLQAIKQDLTKVYHTYLTICRLIKWFVLFKIIVISWINPEQVKQFSVPRFWIFPFWTQKVPRLLFQRNGVSLAWQGTTLYTSDKLTPRGNIQQSWLERRFTFGRQWEQMMCWSSQENIGAAATSRQTGHSSSFSFASIWLLM